MVAWWNLGLPRLVFRRAAVVDGARISTAAPTGYWQLAIYKWGWQFSGTQNLDEGLRAALRRFGAVWENATVARRSAEPLGIVAAWTRRLIQLQFSSIRD